MSSATAAPITAVHEYDAIKKTMDTYIAGGRSGKSADMRPAFHADATIHGYIGADLFGGPIQSLYDWVDNNPPASDVQARLASVDVQGTIASARVEIDNWSGHRFTDLFTLLKHDGQWKIISKVFYLHP